MKIDDFIESAYNTLLSHFPERLEVHIVRFSLVVSLVLLEVENIVIATGAKPLGMDLHFSFTSFAGLDVWLPIYFLVASIAETLGMMLFF